MISIVGTDMSTLRVKYCPHDKHVFRRQRPSRKTKPPYLMLSRCRRCPALLFQAVQSVEAPNGDLIPKLNTYLILIGQTVPLDATIYRKLTPEGAAA